MVDSSNSQNRKEPPPRLPRNVKLLGAASLLNDVASEMIYPLMPILASLFLLAWPGKLRLLFLLTLLPGMIVVALLVFGLREVPVEKPSQERLRLTLAPFDRNFRLYLLALAVFTLGNSSDAFLLVRAGELGVPTALLPLLWCVFHLVKSGGNLLSGRAVEILIDSQEEIDALMQRDLELSTAGRDSRDSSRFVCCRPPDLGKEVGGWPESLRGSECHVMRNRRSKANA